MDFDGAIRAHSDWKMKLSSYLRHADGSLKAADIQWDNRCALGQWIYGEGAAFSKEPGFAELKQAHTQFHAAAAEVVQKADAKQDVTEQIALGAASPFGAASKTVVGSLMKLKFIVRPA
jgi:methyl-accepting chemotaxis protein